MFGIGWYGGVTRNGSGATRDLQRYARWEYGERDVEWLVTAVRDAARPTRADRGPSLAERFRRWLASFRGHAAFDVRGVDEPERT